MPIVMQPVRTGPGAVPSISYALYAPADAIVLGSVLIVTAGQFALAGVNPALVAGVALQAKETAPGYKQANDPTVNTGREAKIAVAIADRNEVFEATLTNASAVRIAPVQADVMAQYGITEYAGVWTVDKGKTAALARVQVVGINTEKGTVQFKWIAAFTYGNA